MRKSIVTGLALLLGLAILSEAGAQGEVVKYVRYEYEGAVSYGILEGQVVQQLDGDLFASPKPTGRSVALADVRKPPDGPDISDDRVVECEGADQDAGQDVAQDRRLLKLPHHDDGRACNGHNYGEVFKQIRFRFHGRGKSRIRNGSATANDVYYLRASSSLSAGLPRTSPSARTRITLSGRV